MIDIATQRLRWLVPAMVLVFTLVGCGGDPIGTPCEIVGSGFTASQDCRHKCLQYRAIRCPDGQEIRPKRCSGSSRCTPGSCPDGQLCYAVADPFNEESYCVLEDICGAPLMDAAGAEWERASFDRARATREERAPSGKPQEATQPAPTVP